NWLTASLKLFQSSVASSCLHLRSFPTRRSSDLSFLLGRWEGVGVAGYAEEEEFQFGQKVVFSTREGLPYLDYSSKAWRLKPDGTLGELITEESGYWRALSKEDTAQYAKDDEKNIVHVEVLISHNEGFIESYLGNVFANRVEM